MHKGLILLTKAEDREDAQSKADEFMEGYGEGRVWDWYVIGGRWSGSLNENDMKFNVLVKEKYPIEEGHFGYTDRFIKENREGLQELWESLGETSTNPYTRDQYNHEGAEDDIKPLNECLVVVKDWQKGHEDELKRCEEQIAEYHKRNDRGMEGHLLVTKGNLMAEYFCFETSVYNIDEYDYRLPEDTNGWYAVMIDMHN